MKIQDASNELYQTLREYDDVIGTGVEERSNVIVVYLQKASKLILGKIPNKFRGKTVRTQVAGKFNGF